MPLATVLISGRDWLLPAAGFVVAGLVLLLWSYGRAQTDGWVRGIGLFLKLLGLLALAACLVDPLWTGQRARPGANYFLVLADDSQSLLIKTVMPRAAAASSCEACSRSIINPPGRRRWKRTFKCGAICSMRGSSRRRVLGRLPSTDAPPLWARVFAPSWNATKDSRWRAFSC